MPRLSILIPSTGNPEQLELTLVSVLENRPADSEVLVLHAGDYDDPYRLDGEVRFVVSQDGMLPLINAGVQAARGDVIHLLAAGVLATDGWVEAALRHFDAHDESIVAAVTPLVFDLHDRGRLVSAGVGYGASGTRREPGSGATVREAKLRKQVAGPSLSAGFYRADVLQSLGGFDVTMGELADIDLAMTLKALGYRTEWEPYSRAYATATPPHKDASPFCTSQRRERLFWRHAATEGWVTSLLLHPFAVFGDLPRPMGLLGRAMAGLEFLGQARFRRRLRNAIHPADIIAGGVGATKRPPPSFPERRTPSLIDTRAA